jgi:uncharacterized protein YndB with AHSA1/START domain
MNTTTSQITINAPAKDVWAALTEPELVKQWQYGSDLITDWNVGSPIKFHSEFGDQVFDQWGNVLTFEPYERIAYSLFAHRSGLEDKQENYFTMEYLLTETGGQTTLAIKQEDPRAQATANSDEDDSGNAVLEGLKKLIETQRPRA